MADSIDRVFGHALNTINKIRTTSSKPPVTDRLALYGLYKQAMEGDVASMFPRPGGASEAARKEQEKWDAWSCNAGMSRTEAKRAYIEKLIGTMRRYATGTEEARELVGELEFVWDQVKVNGLSEGGDGSGSGRLRELRPERGQGEEDGDADEDEFVDAPVSQFEGEGRSDAGDRAAEDGGPRKRRVSVVDMRWRKRVESAIVKMTTELAALRELVESRRHGAVGKRPSIVSWILASGWFLVKLVVVDVFVLWLVLLHLRRKKDRRLEGAIRVMLGDAQAVAKNLATTMQNKLPSRK